MGMRWIVVALWCALWCATAATCGQKGPLYLPEEDARAGAPAGTPAGARVDAVGPTPWAAPGL